MNSLWKSKCHIPAVVAMIHLVVYLGKALIAVKNFFFCNRKQELKGVKLLFELEPRTTKKGISSEIKVRSSISQLKKFSGLKNQSLSIFLFYHIPFLVVLSHKINWLLAFGCDVQPNQNALQLLVPTLHTHQAFKRTHSILGGFLWAEASYPASHCRCPLRVGAASPGICVWPGWPVEEHQRGVRAPKTVGVSSFPLPFWGRSNWSACLFLLYE